MLEKHMKESIYEISYILVPSLPAEKVGTEVAAFNAILAKNSAVVLAEEAPAFITLAYEMDKSTGGGSHTRYNEGYFGWVKFSAMSSAIEAIRKAFDQNPNTLRTLAVTTLKENTYLGKRAKTDSRGDMVKPAEAAAVSAEIPTAAVIATLSAAEIAKVDKSIDDMVKGS
jgi:ribosomal protein S6